MLDFSENDLKATAEKILDMHPDPVPRFRLLRDVLWLDSGDTAYHDANMGLQESKWIALLIKNPLPFHTKYPLLILSATDRRLPDDLEGKLLDFVMHSPLGIYYIYGKDISVLPPIPSRDFWPWFCAHRLLSRFRLWRERSVEVVNWIWGQRTPEGFWDLGSKIGRKPFTCFPLSESWRQPKNRIIDCTVEMLDLLSNRGFQ